MDQIMNSDLSNQEKIDQLNDLRDEFVASQEGQNDFDSRMDDIVNSDLSNQEKIGQLNDLRDEFIAEQERQTEVSDTMLDQNDLEEEKTGGPVKVLRKGPGDTVMSKKPEYDEPLYDANEGFTNWESESSVVSGNDILQRPEDTADKSMLRYEFPENAEIVKSTDELDMSEAMGLDDPNFWNHHNNSHEKYLELASHLSEVQQRLDAGEPLDSLRQDPVVGATANQYYSHDNMIHLNRGENGGYRFIDDGRHRVLAAREQGLDFPAIIEEDR